MKVSLFITGTQKEILGLTKLKTRTLDMTKHRPNIERAVSERAGVDLKLDDWVVAACEDRITLQFNNL